MIAREDRLFLVTNRHVLFDELSRHSPDRIEIELHTELDDVVRAAQRLSMLLYHEGKSGWRAAADSGGKIDVAVIEIGSVALPQPSMPRASRSRGQGRHGGCEHVHRPGDRSTVLPGPSMRTVVPNCRT